MSLRKLAKELGVSRQFLSQIKAGKRPLPVELGKRIEALNACHFDENDVVPVAQGIERLPSKQRVAGSNPAWDARFNSDR